MDYNGTVYETHQGPAGEGQYVPAPVVDSVQRAWGPAYGLEPNQQAFTAEDAAAGALVPYAPVEAYLPRDNFYTQEMASAPMRPAKVADRRFEAMLPKERPRAPKFWKNFLALHNYYREKHDSQVVGWSAEAAAAAQVAADRLAQRDLPGDYPCEVGELGQNYFTVEAAFNMSKSAATTKAVEKWYLQNMFYDYSNPNPGRDLKTRDFVNLVWKDVTAVGGGVAQSRRGNIYVVAYYYPKPKSVQLE